MKPKPGDCIVTGPFVDTKGSNALPFAVCVYIVGLSSTTHRFESSDEAVQFAKEQGGAVPAPEQDRTKRLAAQMAKASRKAATGGKR